MTIKIDVAEGLPAWETFAPCNQEGVNPEIFFPERHGCGRWATRALRLDINRALNFCRDCPVKRPCRQLAREIRADCGIWGGEFLGAARVKA